MKLTSVALVACILVNVCSAVGVSRATLTSIKNGGDFGYTQIGDDTGRSSTTSPFVVGTVAAANVNGNGLVGIAVFKLPELINSFENASLSWTGTVSGTLPTIDIEILRFTILNDSVITGDFGVTAETHVGTLNTQAGETGFENTDLNSALSNNYQVDNFVVMRFRTQTKAH